MTGPSEYEVGLDELVESARVPRDQQVEERDVGEHPELDADAGHLPGDVRPYGA